MWEMSDMTWKITETELALTVEKINKINTRAAKRGLSGRLTIDATPVTITKKDEYTGLETSYQMFEVSLGGEAPKYNGWTFIATLDWDAQAGLIARTAPGVETIDRTNLRANECDHCHTNRFRNETYLLRSDAGAQLQVGSSCIKDFLGWETGIAWVSTDDVSSDLDGFCGGSRIPESFGVETVLALAWAVIKLDGYQAGGGTKGAVIQYLTQPPRTQEDRERYARIAPLAAEAVEQAAEVRAWVLSDQFSGASEYVINLKAIAAADFVSIRNIGFLASAPQAMAKWQERTLIRKAQETLPSEYVGKVGEKPTVTVTVSGVRFIPGAYGTTVLYTMVDDAGNIFKWFSSREVLGDKTGEKFTIKGTVKAHEEFRGVKQTVLTRAKVV